MARAKAELKRLEKELASLQVLLVTSSLLPCHLCIALFMGAVDLPPFSLCLFISQHWQGIQDFRAAHSFVHAFAVCSLKV